MLTVIVPVYNEATRVNETLRRVEVVPYETQIIVLDDGSTDGTANVLDEWDRPPFIEVLSHSTNRGKGAAIRTALNHAVGKFTIIQDADLEYDPQDYTKLLQPLLSDRAEVVYGSRYLSERKNFKGRWRFDSGVKLLNLAVRLFYGVRIRETIKRRISAMTRISAVGLIRRPVKTPIRSTFNTSARLTAAVVTSFCVTVPRE